MTCEFGASFIMILGSFDDDGLAEAFIFSVWMMEKVRHFRPF